MPFIQKNGIRFYSSGLLSGSGIVQAIFTRQGGVSPKPWAELNVGGTVGDDPDRVAENRRRAFRTLGRDPGSIYDVWQVHGVEVVCTEGARPNHSPHLKADAILTDRPQVTLFMRFADCVPIFLFDPVRKVVGIVHAGWKGTVLRTASAAVQAMQARYHSRPVNILAAIGPSIGRHHYEVGPEVAGQVKDAFAQDAQRVLSASTGSTKEKFLFDLWEANRLVLEQAGVEQIEVAGICTACQLDDWFSHRGEGGRTGRFGALIALNGGQTA